MFTHKSFYTHSFPSVATPHTFRQQEILFLYLAEKRVAVLVSLIIKKSNLSFYAQFKACF
jgi:hypothetical protein